jgi:hypothetical protein
VPVPLPYFSHVRVLIRSPRELVAFVVVVVESEHGEPTTYRKAASKHDQEDDEPRRDREAHVVPLGEARRALLLDIHRPSVGCEIELQLSMVLWLALPDIRAYHSVCSRQRRPGVSGSMQEEWSERMNVKVERSDRNMVSERAD